MKQGMEGMTAEEDREIIREIMTTYDACRGIWIKRFGTDEGFDTWFTKLTS